MVKNEICLWAASKQNPLFFKICAPKKRTHASNAPVSKIGPDRYILRICYVYVYIKMFESSTKCVKNFLDDSAFMLAHKIKPQEKAAHT